MILLLSIRNIQALATEIYKTLKGLNPVFMKEVFSLKTHCYPVRTENLTYPNPRTILYGLETFGYRGSQIWKGIPKEIQESEDISVFKSSLTKNAKIFANAIYVNSTPVAWDT